MPNAIYESFLKTKQLLKGHEDYPREPGIYAIFLADKVHLGNFGRPGRLIYIGIAKKSLQDRDFAQHFRSGQTGRSTLRRSLGAILKTDLRLKAIPRGGKNDSKRFDNYRFTDPGEQRLTSWMEDSLEIGYWVSETTLTYDQLRAEEEKVTIEQRPTLDLDRRTRRYNPQAQKLSNLRGICRAEAKKNEDL